MRRSAKKVWIGLRADVDQQREQQREVDHGKSRPEPPSSRRARRGEARAPAAVREPRLAARLASRITAPSRAPARPPGARGPAPGRAARCAPTRATRRSRRARCSSRASASRRAAAISRCTSLRTSVSSARRARSPSSRVSRTALLVAREDLGGVLLEPLGLRARARDPRVALVEHAQQRLEHERVRGRDQQHEQHDQRRRAATDRGRARARALGCRGERRRERAARRRSHATARSDRRSRPGASRRLQLASWTGRSPRGRRAPRRPCPLPASESGGG